MSAFSHIPVLGHVEGVGRWAVGDQAGARAANKNCHASNAWVPVVGQIQAATMATVGNNKYHEDMAAYSMKRSTAVTAACALGAAAPAAYAAGTAGVTAAGASQATAAGAGAVFAANHGKRPR